MGVEYTQKEPKSTQSRSAREKEQDAILKTIEGEARTLESERNRKHKQIEKLTKYWSATDNKGLLIFKDGKTRDFSEKRAIINKDTFAKINVEEIVAVFIPNGVIEIKSSTFEDFKSMKIVWIPDSVKAIGESAFIRCESMERIIIPKGVTQIGKVLFAYCKKLKKIIVVPENPVYHSQGNCIIHTEQRTLICGCQSTKIPTDGSVTIIAEQAFASCVTLKNLRIPKGVITISKGAFWGCLELECISISSSVRTIDEESVFYGCSKLKIQAPKDSCAGRYARDRGLWLEKKAQ